MSAFASSASVAHHIAVLFSLVNLWPSGWLSREDLHWALRFSVRFNMSASVIDFGENLLRRGGLTPGEHLRVSAEIMLAKRELGRRSQLERLEARRWYDDIRSRIPDCSPACDGDVPAAVFRMMAEFCMAEGIDHAIWVSRAHVAALKEGGNDPGKNPELALLQERFPITMLSGR